VANIFKTTVATVKRKYRHVLDQQQLAAQAQVREGEGVCAGAGGGGGGGRGDGRAK
jgi:hypothetical protein